MRKIYWFIIDINEHKDGTQKVTFLYSMGWECDKEGHVIEGYGSRYIYRFQTWKRIEQKHLKPIAFESKKEALQTLANIAIGGYLALVPSTYKTCFWTHHEALGARKKEGRTI